MPDAIYIYRVPEFAGGLQYVVSAVPNNDDGYVPGENTIAAFRDQGDAHAFAYDFQDHEYAFGRNCLVHILPSAELLED